MSDRAVDPAVDAAHRALVSTGSEGVVWVAEAAAREALKSIRELHARLLAAAEFEDVEVDHGMRIVLDELAPLIFTTEELAQ